MISAFAPCLDVRKTLTPQLRTDQGETELLLSTLVKAEQTGSILFSPGLQQVSQVPADLDQPELLKGLFVAVQELNQEDKILAFHDRSDGGLFVTILEMCFAGGAGAEINIDGLGFEPLSTLFSEELGAVIQVKAEDKDYVISKPEAQGLDGNVSAGIGKPSSDDSISFSLEGEVLLEQSRTEFRDKWSQTTFKCKNFGTTQNAPNKSMRNGLILKIRA